MLFNTDKIGHGYLPTYLELAARIGTAGRVAELGVADGESLRLWQALFPHGLVVGVDNDGSRLWPAGTIRIVAGQGDPDLPGRIAVASADHPDPGRPGFDLIVDDASHRSDLTRAAFTNLWPLVRPGRWYVIEDWSHCDLMMGDLAAELVEHFRESRQSDVEEIRYRAGLIVIEKRP